MLSLQQACTTMFNLYIQINKYLIVASGRIQRKVLSTIPNELSTQQFFSKNFSSKTFYLPSTEFDPRTLVHRRTNSLSVITNHLAPSVKSTTFFVFIYVYIKLLYFSDLCQILKVGWSYVTSIYHSQTTLRLATVWKNLSCQIHIIICFIKSLQR